MSTVLSHFRLPCFSNCIHYCVYSCSVNSGELNLKNVFGNATVLWFNNCTLQFVANILNGAEVYMALGGTNKIPSLLLLHTRPRFRWCLFSFIYDHQNFKVQTSPIWHSGQAKLKYSQYLKENTLYEPRSTPFILIYTMQSRIPLSSSTMLLSFSPPQTLPSLSAPAVDHCLFLSGRNSNL